MRVNHKRAPRGRYHAHKAPIQSVPLVNAPGELPTLAKGDCAKVALPLRHYTIADIQRMGPLALRALARRLLFRVRELEAVPNSTPSTTAHHAHHAHD